MVKGYNKIVVTGSSGFLARNFINFLKNNGIENIIGVDKIKRDDHFDFIQCDLRSDSLSEILTSNNIDMNNSIVLHFAAKVGAKDIILNPHDLIIDDIKINANIYDVIKKFNSKLVFMSSSEVYGDKQTPMDENSDLMISRKLRSNYALSKLFAERLFFNENTLVVRPFNIIGADQDTSKGVVANFVNKVINKKDLNVNYFNGRPEMRAFCDVFDFCNILYKLIEKNCFGDIYNIGNSNEVLDILSVAEIIIDIASKLGYDIGSTIIKNDESSIHNFNMRIRVPEMSKTLSMIGNYEYIKFSETITNILRGNYEKSNDNSSPSR